MATYRKPKPLKPTDAAYIAGLVDGEGTITLSRRHRGDNRQLVISISNTDRPLLEYVLRVTGVGRITRKRTSSSKHSPSFTYAVNNRHALVLLDCIARHLRTYKAKRGQLILRHYVQLTPRNGKYDAGTAMARRLFEESVLNVKPAGGGQRLEAALW